MVPILFQNVAENIQLGFNYRIMSQIHIPVQTALVNSRPCDFLVTEHLQMSIILNRIHNSFFLSLTQLTFLLCNLSDWCPRYLLSSSNPKNSIVASIHTNPQKMLMLRLLTFSMLPNLKDFFLSLSNFLARFYLIKLTHSLFLKYFPLLAFMMTHFLQFLLLLAFHLLVFLLYLPLKCWCSSGINPGPSFFPVSAILL